MTSKRILKMNMPEVNLYIVIVGIASIFLLYYNFYIGCLFFIGFLYMVFNNWKTTNIRRKEWTNYIQNLSLDIDETTKKAVMNLPMSKSEHMMIRFQYVCARTHRMPRHRRTLMSESPPIR